jgi:hypothetical protein
VSHSIAKNVSQTKRRRLSIATYDSFSLEAFEVLVEALPQTRSVRGDRERFGHHDEVPIRQLLLHAKGFSGEPFQSISIHRSFRRSTGNSQSKSRHITRVRPCEHGEEAIG